jgi:hypothetical protein
VVIHMEKVSQHVLDILSAGIAEYTQNITLMIMAYEDGLDMVEIEEIQSVYEKLETTMLFYQSHATGPDRLLSQELYIRLQETMRRMMGKEAQNQMRGYLVSFLPCLKASRYIQKTVSIPIMFFSMKFSVTLDVCLYEQKASIPYM